MTKDKIIAGLRQVQEALEAAHCIASAYSMQYAWSREFDDSVMSLKQLPAIIAAVEALAQPQELTEDEREEIIYLVQNTYCDTQGKYRDMSIRTVIEAYEAALKAAGCKIVR